MKKNMFRKEYIKSLERKLEKARTSYKIAKNDTIKAEGRMVTRYDSTKTETACLADGYLKEVKELENMINRLKLNIRTANFGDVIEVSVFEKGGFIGNEILKLDIELYQSEKDVFFKLLGVSVNDTVDYELNGRYMQYHVKKIEKERDFDGVSLGSTVCLENEDAEKEYYYLVNGLGGMKINVEGIDAFCVSKQTPIANILLGRNIGDIVKINSEFTYKIVSIENSEGYSKYEKHDENFIQWVYDLMTGNVEQENDSAFEEEYVKNEYEEGGFCSELYEKVYDANRKLCNRLGIGDEEDEDIECIINNLLNIQRHMCMKMYEYGWLFSKMEEGSRSFLYNSSIGNSKKEG